MKRLIGLTMVVLSLAVPSALASELVEVKLGYSQVIGPVREMATVIVGDNGIADATLGGGGTIILTGKSLGATNLIILDEAGRELLSSQLNVVAVDRRPTTNVRILKGAAIVQDYVCGPDPGCSPVAVAAAGSNAPMDDVTGDDTTTQTPETVPELAPETDGTASQDQISLNP